MCILSSQSPGRFPESKLGRLAEFINYLLAGMESLAQRWQGLQNRLQIGAKTRLRLYGVDKHRGLNTAECSTTFRLLGVRFHQWKCQYFCFWQTMHTTITRPASHGWVFRAQIPVTSPESNVCKIHDLCNQFTQPRVFNLHVQMWIAQALFLV